MFECCVILFFLGSICIFLTLKNKHHLHRSFFIGMFFICSLCIAGLPTCFTYYKLKKQFLSYRLTHVIDADGYYNVQDYLKCKAALKALPKRKNWKKNQREKQIESIRLADLKTQKTNLIEVFSKPIPLWIQDLVNEEFSYYALHSFSDKDLKATLTEYQSFGSNWEQEGQFALFSIRQGILFVKDYSKKHPRLEDVSIALNKLCHSVSMPDLDFLVSFHDHLENKPTHVPIFVFSKNYLNKKMILIPDHEHLMGYEDLNKVIDQASESSPWEKKEDLAFWRGGTSGGIYTDPQWKNFPRAKLVFISAEYPELLDAKFSLLVQGAMEHQEFLIERKMIAPILYPEEQIRYRYLIDVDGNASTYSRFYWILRSNCTPIKQTSSFIQWYYPLLTPYQHYVPICEDLSDLKEQIDWIKTHRAEARMIAEASSSFAKEYLNTESTYLYLYALLLKYKECFSGEKQL